MNEEPLTKGEKYKVTTGSGSVFVGKYMGRNQWGDLQFDLRPEHGTTTVRVSDLIKAVEVK